jgi:hypothetical protein
MPPKLVSTKETKQIALLHDHNTVGWSEGKGKYGNQFVMVQGGGVYR